MSFSNNSRFSREDFGPEDWIPNNIGRRQFIWLASAATVYVFGWKEGQQTPPPLGPMLNDFRNRCRATAEEGVVRYSHADPFGDDALDAKQRELVKPIWDKVGGESKCHVALTTGKHLLQHGVENFAESLFKKVGRQLSGRQRAALGELIGQFCKLQGRFESFEDQEDLPVCAWLCPATVSGGFWQDKVHGVYQEMNVKTRETDERSADERTGAFGNNGEIMLPLTDKADGPRVWLRPDLWDFADVGGRICKAPPQLVRTARLREANGVNKTPFDFWTSEVDVSPVFEGFNEEVMDPIVVRHEIGGQRRNIGYTDLNLSLVRFHFGHESWITTCTQKLTLAFRPTDNGLIQVATNFGDLEQYLHVTPGLEVALRRAIEEWEHDTKRS